jgi:hypothetical protein
MPTRSSLLGRLPALCLLTTLIATAFPARADFSFIYAGHDYLVSQTNRTWQAAATNAASRQFAGAAGHLAIIESAAENQAIFSQLVANIPSSQFNLTVASDGGPGSYVWIAANDISVEGTWVWDGDGTGPSPAIPFFQGSRTPPASAWPTGPEASPANGTTSNRVTPSGPSSNSTPCPSPPPRCSSRWPASVSHAGPHAAIEAPRSGLNVLLHVG